MMSSGIYKIVNLKDNKFYIGSAINFTKRKCNHFSDLRKKRHSNKHLQSSFNKYGEDVFKFEVICGCDKSELIELEQLIIDESGCLDDKIGYNICKIAGSSLGLKRSKETIEKMKTCQLGKKLSKEHIDALVKSNLGRKCSDKTKEMIGNANKGRMSKGIDVFKDGVHIETYDSLTECSKALNLYISGISASARGKRKTSGGYSFKFTDITNE